MKYAYRDSKQLAGKWADYAKIGPWKQTCKSPPPLLHILKMCTMKETQNNTSASFV